MELDLGVNSEWAKNGNFSDRFSLPQIELTMLCEKEAKKGEEICVGSGDSAWLAHRQALQRGIRRTEGQSHYYFCLYGGKKRHLENNTHMFEMQRFTKSGGM